LTAGNQSIHLYIFLFLLCGLFGSVNYVLTMTPPVDADASVDCDSTSGAESSKDK